MQFTEEGWESHYIRVGLKISSTWARIIDERPDYGIILWI